MPKQPDLLAQEIARLKAQIARDTLDLVRLEAMRDERQRLQAAHGLGIIPGMTSAQVEAAQRRRRGAAVAAASAAKSGSPVFKAITGSEWRTLTAYAKRAKVSQPTLSRYIQGALECSPEVADQVRKDFGLTDAVWPRPPRR